jgi:methionine salvage enolase-phosphatase E1
VTTKDDTFEDILKHHDLLPTIHANGVNWIMQHGREKSVHVYIIENGSVNAAPFLFDTLMEANGHLGDCYPFNHTL